MKKRRVVAVRLSEAMVSRLRGAAGKRCLSLSEAMREAVRNYIRSSERTPGFAGDGRGRAA
jgi:metal-responsive CopG/Arc/MetJ family transcriptional regulator